MAEEKVRTLDISNPPPVDPLSPVGSTIGKNVDPPSFWIDH